MVERLQMVCCDAYLPNLCLSHKYKLGGIFTPWKSVNATNNVFWGCFFFGELVVKHQPGHHFSYVLSLRSSSEKAVIQRGLEVFPRPHSESQVDRDDSPGLLRTPPQHTSHLCHVSVSHNTLDAQNTVSTSFPNFKRKSFTMAVSYHCQKFKLPAIPPASENQC